MFEKYKNEQSIANKTLSNAIKNNKLSHAYIFETNGYNEAYDYVISFIKYILCNQSRTTIHDESKCNVCSAINSNNYIEMKIINPSTLQIKKEEIISLQNEFRDKPIEGNKKIYLIRNAEKLNSSSSNTILKFLEEPEENIIAILLVNSRYQLLKTIISRCQIISLNKEKEYRNNDIVKIIYNSYYSNCEFNQLIIDKINDNVIKAIEFIKNVEKMKIDMLLFEKKYFLQYFSERENIIAIFDIIKFIYYSILKSYLNEKFMYFDNYSEELSMIKNSNNITSIAYKLENTNEAIENIKKNMNINLVLDRYIMKTGGKNND